MNLSAIKIGRNSTAQQAAKDTAQRNLGATHGNLLFRDTAPVLAVITKAIAATSMKPVAPEASTGDLVSVMRTLVAPITASIERATAALKATASPLKTPLAAPVAPAVTRRSSGSPPSVPMMTDTQRRREAEGREEARKAAVRAHADHVLVTKGGSRVITFRALNAGLSDAALLALNHIVREWEANDRRPIRIYASDLSSALDVTLATAQAAYTELVEKHLIMSTKNSAGVLLVMPGLGVTGV